MTVPANMMSLPADVRVAILKNLSIHDIVHLVVVNKEFYNWSKTDPKLWKMIYERNFGGYWQIQLQDLVTILNIFQKDDYSHDAYRTLTLAYADNVREDSGFDDMVNEKMYFTLDGKFELELDNRYVNVEKRKTRQYRDDYGEENPLDPRIPEMIRRLFGDNKNMTDTYSEFNFYYRGYFPKAFGYVARIIMSYNLIRLGYYPDWFYGYHNVIKSKICNQCGTSESKLRLENTQHTFCSQKCASLFLE